MTQLQWQQLQAVIAGMNEAERERLAGMLSHTLTTSDSLHPENPSLGLFADEPELIDEIMEGVYRAREQHPFRAGE